MFNFFNANHQISNDAGCSNAPVTPNSVVPLLHFPPPPLPPSCFVGQTDYLPMPPTHEPPKSRNISDEELSALVSQYKTTLRAPDPKLNVSTVAVLLSGYKRLIVSTERALKYLEVTKKSLSEEDWASRREDLYKKKDLLLDMEQQLGDPFFVELVQKTVKQAKKKRDRLKRKRLQWKEEKKEMRESREQKHKEIDLWLERMKDEVERAHRIEMVKKEADLVLFDVVQKKAEAKRILGLINSLTKLRNAKVTQASSSSKPASLEETRTFGLVTDKLKKLWVKQLKEYNMEEQGLKVMLNDAEVERVNSEEKMWRKNLQLWTKAFFGVSQLVDPLQAQPSDMDNFTLVRNDWDQFASSEDNAVSSRIPSGWVVPEPPSNSTWSSFVELEL